MIIARILQASAPGGGSGKTIACRLSPSKSAKSAAKNLFRSGSLVSPNGRAAVPVIYRTRKIDDNQRRTAAIVAEGFIRELSLDVEHRAVANAVVLYVTIDHQVIRSWAQRLDARPSTFEGDEHPWPLLFSFGSAGTGVQEISWERFFAEFEQADLAFIYRDTGQSGEVDDFHEFVKRAAMAKLVASGRSTIAEPAL